MFIVSIGGKLDLNVVSFLLHWLNDDIVSIYLITSLQLNAIFKILKVHILFLIQGFDEFLQLLLVYIAKVHSNISFPEQIGCNAHAKKKNCEEKEVEESHYSPCETVCERGFVKVLEVCLENILITWVFTSHTVNLFQDVIYQDKEADKEIDEHEEH